mgnify:CR=1 FL=1
MLAPDWRGFGLSEAPQDGYWFLDYTADLDALVRALAREWGTKKTDLGAGSWGVGVGGDSRLCAGWGGRCTRVTEVAPRRTTQRAASPIARAMR